MKEITIPKKLVPLFKAFSAQEQSAKLLIIEAVKSIYCKEEGLYGFSDKEPSKGEIEGIIALMQGIAPRDTLEMIYAAQLIASHIMGLRLLSNKFPGDQALGLKLLRFSNEAMTNLQKKRAGGISQNINITYNHDGPGPALMQTVIPKDQSCQ